LKTYSSWGIEFITAIANRQLGEKLKEDLALIYPSHPLCQSSHSPSFFE
jgi:hypothetical protein